MKEWNIPKLLKILNESARMALQYWNISKVSIKQDGSVVTQADQIIEDYLTDQLNSTTEGSFLLGEESLSKQTEEYISKALSQVAWIVDPIDGTSPYFSGLPHWGISIGYAQAGKLKHGAVYLVPLGELFITSEEHVLYAKVNVGSQTQMKDLRPLLIKRSPINQSSILSFSRIWNKRDLTGLDNPIHSTGSSVFSLMKLMQGCYLAVITKFCLWDGAACFPMLSKAGYLSFFLEGEELNLEINNQNYNLEADSPYRWTLRNTVIITGSKKSLAYTQKICRKAKLIPN